MSHVPSPSTIAVAPGRKNDWAYAQLQWESTDKSAPTIAAEIGVQPTALISHASRCGWTRDRARNTTAQAAALLLANTEAMNARRRAELEVIEKVNAAMQAEVLSKHRKDISAARTACTTLMDRVLTAQAEEDEPELEELQRRANIMVKLSTSMKTLVLLERQALGITTVLQDPEDGDTGAQTPQAAALDMLVNKFASVLQNQHPAQVVVDVTPAATDQPA